MNVVWHDNERMQIIMAKRTRVVMDGFYHQSGHGWLPEVERPGAGLLQEAVQCGKGLAGAECPGREGSMRGQTAVEPPGEKNRLFGGGDVRKPAPIKHHAKVVSSPLRDSRT